jgi:hypothetical protein
VFLAVVVTLAVITLAKWAMLYTVNKQGLIVRVIA